MVRGIPSLHEQIARNCIHFNGVMNDTCEAGIVYADVKDMSRHGLERFPCFREGPRTCSACEFPTEEYIAARIAAIEASGRRWADLLSRDMCPHCETPITRYDKVGRCVYARPCNHRLYQGDPPKDKPHTVTRLNDGWDDV